MDKLDRQQVEEELRYFVGERAYVHCEATSYVFVRNLSLVIKEARMAGDVNSGYRVALRFDELGWLRMEGLTHYEVDVQGRLLLAGFDDRGRMDVALHVSKEAFPE